MVPEHLRSEDQKDLLGHWREHFKSNFEFLSEAEMESMGWSEKLWVISKHFGPPKVLVTQMYLFLWQPSVRLPKEEDQRRQEASCLQANIHQEQLPRESTLMKSSVNTSDVRLTLKKVHDPSRLFVVILQSHNHDFPFYFPNAPANLTMAKELCTGCWFRRFLATKI